MSYNEKINDSEIINQKKQILFRVEQTSSYVFPNEEYVYYIYIKNISGSKIEDFTIKVENPESVHFEEKNKLHKGIDINPDQVLLYEMKAYCSETGKHIVHFIGLGEETQVVYENLEILCTTSYNSEKLIHKLHIYDFTPYEQNYSMESTNYSSDVTQTFKRQKLPYRSGEQPFPLQSNDISENTESKSFLDQYEEAKNTKEHVYQYISRENFTEDSVESYTGENLAEIFDKINAESKYLKGEFFRTGTNHLLNDFKQYAPNGFIHRMGLLSSEIYHYLGVIPTYTYMSDFLFRWAPTENQLLDLTPKKRAMKWDENIWAGRSWIVYRDVTQEYEETEEFERKYENKLIEKRKIIGKYEQKWVAEEIVKQYQKMDNIERNYEQSDLVKFDYVISETFYDTGVFFINIPVNKIPSNFYLLEQDDLYAIINRVKPLGTKPIINYIIETTFNQHMKQELVLNYYKDFNFYSDMDDFIEYNIFSNKFIKKDVECNGQVVNSYVELEPTNVALNKSFQNEQDMTMNLEFDDICFYKNFEHDTNDDYYFYQTQPEYQLKTFKNILDMLSQGNYNNMSFKFGPKSYEQNPYFSEKMTEFSREEGVFRINNKQIESLKLKIIRSNSDSKDRSNSYSKGLKEKSFIIEDSFNRKHKISVKKDIDTDMDHIIYTYINNNGKEFIREEGYEKIESISIVFGQIQSKYILVFMVEDSKKYFHYFSHVLIQDLESIEVVETNLENQNIENIYSHMYIARNILNSQIIFETPFVKKTKSYESNIIEEGNNWVNLYRLNKNNDSYALIRNLEVKSLSPDNIILHYDNIDIPETAIIKQARLKINGSSTKKRNVYIAKALNTNYLKENSSGFQIQLSPNKIESYSKRKESTTYYEIKLDLAKKKEQTTLIQNINNLLEDNYIFDEDIGFNPNQYLDAPNDFITINKDFWCELSEFTNNTNKLNEIESMNLVIEGYNDFYERDIIVSVLSETESSSTIKKTIPSGYFRKKIPLLFPNHFMLELLRVRFRFEDLNHDIRIFDTKLEVNFKNKQTEEIFYESFDEINLNEKNSSIILEDYYNPCDINNGLSIKLGFDDLYLDNYYQINSVELEIIYEDTDIEIMVNNNKYKDIFYGINKSGISGKYSGYLSGEFYDDVQTMSQNESNVGIDNQGIKLENSLYQSFETRDNNITSIELYPYGFRGNPDENLKIGLYKNSFNTPGQLIKEVTVRGWTKNNEELKGLDKIKYNLNVDNLTINEKYWIKIQVLNPKEGSYYLLKGINQTKSGFKLLANENNNYINTFNNLKFNIYSKNLSKSFNYLSVLQESFDNPYAFIGLHKGQGFIKDLQVDKYIKSVSGNDFMSEIFENEPVFDEQGNEKPSFMLLDMIIKSKNSTGEEEE